MSQLQSSNNQKQRSHLVGWSLVVLGTFLLLIATPAIVLVLFGGAIGGAIGGGLVGLLSTLGISLLFRGRRMVADDAAALLQRDKRPAIVYLRPFSEDGIILRRSFFSELNSKERMKLTVLRMSKFSTYEERIAAALKKVGPFVGVGNPSEKLPQIGAARMYMENAGWQKSVTELLIKSGLVLIHTGQSDGLLWETHEAVKALAPEQLILCLPIPDKSGTVARQEKFSIFHAKTLGIFPKPLPKQIDDALFLFFDKEWNANLLTPHKSWRLPSAMADEGSTTHLQMNALKNLNLEFMLARTPKWLRGFFVMTVVTFVWLGILFVLLILRFF